MHPPPPFEPVAPPLPGDGCVLVTGAGGFIGRHAVSAFARAGWRTAGLSNGPAGQDGQDLHAPDVWVAGKVKREGLSRAAASLGAPRLIIHAAGGSSVGASLADPARDFDRTVGSVAETLAFMTAEAPDARLIFLSSAAVYGQAGRSPLAEDAPTAPVSPYGRHKRAAEELIEAWAGTHGLDAVIVRFFSVYGPGIRKQIFWDLAGKLAADPPSLELGGTGEEARDFLHVEDAVRFLGRLACAPRQGGVLTVNGGGGRATTVREAAEALARAMDRRTRIGFSGQVRSGDPSSLVADPTLARSLGLEPQVELEPGLESFAAWAEPLLEAGDG
jgi:UDP-glucose 4-epimerase